VGPTRISSFPWKESLCSTLTATVSSSSESLSMSAPRDTVPKAPRPNHHPAQGTTRKQTAIHQQNIPVERMNWHVPVASPSTPQPHWLGDCCLQLLSCLHGRSPTLILEEEGQGGSTVLVAVGGGYQVLLCESVHGVPHCQLGQAHLGELGAGQGAPQAPGAHCTRDQSVWHREGKSEERENRSGGRERESEGMASAACGLRHPANHGCLKNLTQCNTV